MSGMDAQGHFAGCTHAYAFRLHDVLIFSDHPHIRVLSPSQISECSCSQIQKQNRVQSCGDGLHHACVYAVWKVQQPSIHPHHSATYVPSTATDNFDSLNLATRTRNMTKCCKCTWNSPKRTSAKFLPEVLLVQHTVAVSAVIHIKFRLPRLPQSNENW